MIVYKDFLHSFIKKVRSQTYHNFLGGISSFLLNSFAFILDPFFIKLSMNIKIEGKIIS